MRSSVLILTIGFLVSSSHIFSEQSTKNVIKMYDVYKNHQSEKQVKRQPIPTVIIFDFGGVIGGTNEKKACSAIAKTLNIPEEEALHVIGLIKKGSKNALKDLPPHWISVVEKAKKETIELHHDMMALVKDLKNHVRVAMLSNVTAERAEHIEELGFYDPFDPVILSCKTGVKKPDTKAYILLIESLQEPPEHCLLIDNKPENLQAAERLGFQTLLFTSYENLVYDLQAKGIPVPICR